MASPDPWVDFETLRHNVKHNTVDRLKQILSGFNDECQTHFSKSGKKQEIIDRIVGAMDNWRASNTDERWSKAKAVLYQVRNSGVYTPTRQTQSSGSTSMAHNGYVPGSVGKTASLSGIGMSTGIGRYDPYAPPRKPPGSSLNAVPSSPGTVKVPGGQKPSLRFKDSPFFRVDQAVIPQPVECPESSSASDRRQQSVIFTLNNDQINKLRADGSKYQLRLFCTSSAFYSPSPSFRTNTVPALIEFPPTCEVRVNNVQLTANLKGLKKKPGTAPPPDLGKYVRMNSSSNRIEMVYVNSQQPVHPPKKFYLMVMLVETTNVDTLVASLKQNHFKSSADIKQKMKMSSGEDDDIIAGPQKMSLKCPLSFMRVNTPCRSSECVHPQCFDATSWYSVMEQTTTWLCPVCEKALDSKDLIIDGYFDEILKQTPDSVDDVMVEADGEWHTTDNKYGSSEWKAQHPAAVANKAPPKSPSKPVSVAKPPSQATGSSGANGKMSINEIVVLDSDDEDEGRVKRELSPSFASRSSVSYTGSAATSVPKSVGGDDVIDLTLDSDDEEPPVSKQAGKRKADEAGLSSTSPTEPIWKKGRVDAPSVPLTVARDESSRGGESFSPQTPPRLPSRTVLPPPAPNRYNGSYPSTLPPIYNSASFPARAGGSNVPQLPPIPGSSVYRNNNSQWP